MASCRAEVLPAETVSVPGPLPESARVHWAKPGRVPGQSEVKLTPDALRARPVAGTGPSFRRVRFGRSPLERLRLVPLPATAIIASMPPEPLQATPSAHPAGSRSRTVLGSRPDGACVSPYSKT